jgi:hypothetical protein
MSTQAWPTVSVFSSIRSCLLQDGDKLMRRASPLYLSAHLKTSLEFSENI